MSSGAHPGLNPIEADSPRQPDSVAMAGARSPLQHLLHALNQPLTGLQCSMEVALAGLRTPEQYVRGLREGLELTERMRALVEAIREVADVEEEVGGEAEAVELKTILQEVLDDLQPVAGLKSVHITLDTSADSVMTVKIGRRRSSTLVFRLLESALSLAERGSALQIEMGGGADVAGVASWICIRWHAGPRRTEFSRPELGLLVAQAGWEHAGAKWERKRTESLETVTLRLPRIAAEERSSQASSSFLP